VQEAEEMVATAKRTGARLQVGHIERFNPGFQAMTDRELNPLFIEAHRLSPFPFRAVDVGVVFDLMIHDIDIIQTLVPSEIRDIDAIGVSVISNHEDIANARITFENECVANLTASRISLKRMRKVRVFSDDCYVTMDTGERKAIVYRKKPGFEEVARKLRGQSALKTIMGMGLGKMAYDDLVEIQNVKLDHKEPLHAELESFVSCVREGREPEVPGEDGMKAVRTAETIVTQIYDKFRAKGRTIHM
jgi:predicted dehydrogenase